MNPRSRCNLAPLGLVLRGIMRGEVVGMLSEPIGHFIGIYEVEISAIQHALSFCIQFKFQNVAIESEYSLIVSLVTKRSNKPIGLIYMFNLINFLRAEVNYIEISDIYLLLFYVFAVYLYLLLFLFTDGSLGEPCPMLLFSNICSFP